MAYHEASPEASSVSPSPPPEPSLYHRVTPPALVRRQGHANTTYSRHRLLRQTFDVKSQPVILCIYASAFCLHLRVATPSRRLINVPHGGLSHVYATATCRDAVVGIGGCGCQEMLVVGERIEHRLPRRKNGEAECWPRYYCCQGIITARHHQSAVGRLFHYRVTNRGNTPYAFTGTSPGLPTYR